MGNQVSDCKLRSLQSALAATGAVSDLELEYVQSLQSTRHPAEDQRNQISDAWQSLFFLDTGIENRTDAAVVWLKSEGATGEHISDLWFDYWCNIAAGGDGAFDSGFSPGFA